MDAFLLKIGHSLKTKLTLIYVQWSSAFFLFIGLYVDDTILVSNHIALLASIKETLSKECEMTNSGEIALKYFKN
jgi:hypothetical protein